MSGVQRDELSLSPGAGRVVTAAQESAPGRGIVTGCRLLHALWQDESRAAEAMRAAGFDSASAKLIESAMMTNGSAADDVLPAVLGSARRIAGRRGEGEIGTEHLLAALLEIDENARDLLPTIDLDALMGLEGANDASAEPLEFDEELRVGGRPVALNTRHSTLDTPPDALRILDAAANRGREGLRVIEDLVRFRMNDGHLSGSLKTLRHELADALTQLGGDAWYRLRDTPGDVGTDLETPQELERKTLDDVVRANCKRVEESLRSLEEYGKLIDAGTARVIEQLRYRFYTIETAVLTTVSSRCRLDQCRLYLLVGEADCPQGIERTVREALAGGVDMIQLREKEGDDRRFLELARQIREWTHDAGALFFVNDRPDIAVLSDADGVHVGQEDMSCREARRIVGGERLVGISTHAIEQARQAVLDGADCIGVGPVFPSATKEFAQLAGLEYVRDVAGEVSLPWFAIGGIDKTNIIDVVAAGATRVAVSRAVCCSDEVSDAVQALKASLPDVEVRA